MIHKKDTFKSYIRKSKLERPYITRSALIFVCLQFRFVLLVKINMWKSYILNIGKIAYLKHAKQVRINRFLDRGCLKWLESFKKHLKLQS